MGKHIQVLLTDEQRNELEQLIRRSQGHKRTDAEIAAALLCCKGTVRNVRLRFREGGLPSALYDKPRPGQKPKFTSDVQAKLIMLACSDPPAGHRRWALRLLADRMVEPGYVDYIRHVTVRALLKKTGSSPGGSSPGALANCRGGM